MPTLRGSLQPTRKLPGAIDADKNYFTEKIYEKKLDGSRDYYRNRDHGQFGSLPTYDDYGEDSDP